jgi:ATP/maltotriose-dependent transcriptional regulator MalT/DNA-binding SARP family transcriptional activator
MLYRPRLIDRSAVPGSLPRLVLVLGMPGSGKSVLLDAWVNATALPSGRVTLRRRSPLDSTVLAPALRQLGLIGTDCVESLDQITSPCILAIDNLDHVLDDHGVPSAVTQLWLNEILDNPNLTLVATSKVFPALPIMGRLATKGLLKLIGAADLAFNPAECAALWTTHRQNQLSESDLAAMYAATGGWAAPVLLRCYQRFPRDQTLLSLLVEDVLVQLSPLQRQRLTSVALLDRLSAPQVASLSGVANGERLIDEWQHLGYVQSNADITLQPLLKVALQRALQADPAAYNDATLATATWFAQQDDFESVARLAHKTQHWSVLMRIFGQHSAALHSCGRYAEVIGWLAKVPADALSAEVGSLLVRCYVGVNNPAGALLLLSQLLGQRSSASEQRTWQLLKAEVCHAAGDCAAADGLVTPYLLDMSLSPTERASVLRIHGVALAAGGAEAAGLDCLAGAATLLERQGACHVLGMVLNDYARVAVQLGKYPLAERLLLQVERIWHDLSAPAAPDLATTLNLEALVALHTGRLDEAERLAQAAYEHGIATGSSRTIAVTLITQADIALARQYWDIAVARYDLASGQLHQVGDLAQLPYVLAMQAQAARHTNNLDTVRAVLQQLEVAAAPVPLDHAWLAAGKAAAYLKLGVSGGERVLEQALALLSGPPALAHGLLTLLLAETHWSHDNHSAAKTSWRQLDQLLDGPGGSPVILGALANHAISLLGEAHLHCRSAFAGRVASATPTAHDTTPLLTLRVHGQITVAWHNQEVKLPRHGVLLLTLLLLSAGSGMTADELRQRLWGSDGGSADSWRKLLQRVRKVLPPKTIVLENTTYRLGLAPEEIDADVLLVRHRTMCASDAARLRTAAAYAAMPLLPGSDEAWVVGERKDLSLRGAELWYAVGNLDCDGRQFDAAAAAYATALQLNPLCERAVVAAMTLALEHGQRCAAIGIYQAYSQQMLDEMGLDPCPTIDALYRRALEP